MDGASSSDGSLEPNGNYKRLSNEKSHPSEFMTFCTLPDQTSTAFRPGHTRNAASDARPSVQHAEDRRTPSSDDLFRGLSAAIPDLRRLSFDARAATQAERKMTFMYGCKLYPKAIAWSALLTATIIMEGFSGGLITNFYGFPRFRRRYGVYVEASGNYQISPEWQAGLQNAAVGAEIIGLFFNGYLTDKFGYNKTMCGAILANSVIVFISFFAFNIETLLAYQILVGVPWGIFQTLSMTYAAEIMPITMRAYLLSTVNMCWLIGQITSVGILRSLLHVDSEWSYRVPFGLQWAFIAPTLVGIFFAPESPTWLVRHGRVEAAKQSLTRLTSKGMNFNIDQAISMISHTNEVEKYLDKGGLGWSDCFKGTNLRRTEIAVMVWISQCFCGATLTGWGTYYFEQAGFDPANSFNLATGMYGLSIIGGIIAWFLMPRIGRRRLYITGLLLMFLILITSGIIGVVLKGPAGSWTVGSMLIVFTFIYNITVGPVCYVMVAEIPSTRLRAKTVVLARISYNVTMLIAHIVNSAALNPRALNLAAKTNFIWAGTCLFCLVWCYFRLPETQGLSYLEIDILFLKKAKARVFRTFQVNLAATGYFSLTERSERSGSVWRGY